MSKYCETGSEGFWSYVNRHRQKLEDIVNKKLEDIVNSYHPSKGRNYSKTITAPIAEAARQDVVAEIGREGPIDIKSSIDNKDEDKLITALNETWFGVPESTDCWSIPGFSELCTICEEGISSMEGINSDE